MDTIVMEDVNQPLVGPEPMQQDDIHVPCSQDDVPVIVRMMASDATAIRQMYNVLDALVTTQVAAVALRLQIENAPVSITPGEMFRRMIQEWLSKNGCNQVTWTDLENTLRTLELNDLADNIKDFQNSKKQCVKPFKAEAASAGIEVNVMKNKVGRLKDRSRLLGYVVLGLVVFLLVILGLIVLGNVLSRLLETWNRCYKITPTRIATYIQDGDNNSAVDRWINCFEKEQDPIANVISMRQVIGGLAFNGQRNETVMDRAMLFLESLSNYPVLQGFGFFHIALLSRANKALDIASLLYRIKLSKPIIDTDNWVHTLALAAIAKLHPQLSYVIEASEFYLEHKQGVDSNGQLMISAVRPRFPLCAEASWEKERRIENLIGQPYPFDHYIYVNKSNPVSYDEKNRDDEWDDFFFHIPISHGNEHEEVHCKDLWVLEATSKEGKTFRIKSKDFSGVYLTMSQMRDARAPSCDGWWDCCMLVGRNVSDPDAFRLRDSGDTHPQVYLEHEGTTDWTMLGSYIFYRRRHGVLGNGVCQQ